MRMVWRVGFAAVRFDMAPEPGILASTLKMLKPNRKSGRDEARYVRLEITFIHRWVAMVNYKCCRREGICGRSNFDAIKGMLPAWVASMVPAST